MTCFSRILRSQPLLLLGFFAFSFAIAPARESPLLWSTDLQVGDFAVLEDGQLAVAASDRVRLFDRHFQETSALDLQLDRIFADRSGEFLSAGIERTRAEVQLHLHPFTEPRADLTFPMERANSAHLAGDGAIWIANPTGLITRIHDGKTSHWDARDHTQSGRVYGNEPFRFEFTESPEGKIALVQQGGFFGYGSSLQGLMIWENGEMRRLQIGSGNVRITPACAEFLSENELLLGDNSGLRTFDIHSGEILDTVSPPPGFYSRPIRPVFTRLLPDDTRIVFYCHRGHSAGDHHAFEHGGFTQILEIKDGAWRKIPMKLDSRMWSFLQVERPVLVDEHGGMWIANRGEGLAYRSPNGTWRALGWEAGVPFETISRMALDGDRLWIASAGKGLAVLDIPRLLEPASKPSGWDRLSLAAAPVWCEAGDLYLLSNEEGGIITRLPASGEPERISLPPHGYNSAITQYLTLDSDGGIWLFGGFYQGGTIAVRTGENWQIHSRRGNRALPHHVPEIAFQDMRGRDPSFRIGFPGDSFYPVFSEDGRIVFRNRWRRVSYFDGRQWHAPYGGREIDGNALSCHPFFHDGLVTARIGNRVYQMKEEDWTDKVDDRAERPWVEVEGVESPFADQIKPATSTFRRSPGIDEIRNLPPNCPLAPEEVEWIFHRNEWTWVGGATLLAASPGQGWLSLDHSESPLAAARGIREILWQSGSPVLIRHQKHGHVFSIYTPPPLHAEITEPHLGTLEALSMEILPGVGTDREPEELWMRFRINDREWSGLLPFGPLLIGSVETKGEQTLSLRLYGKHDFSRSRELRYHFDNAFDVQDIIAPNIRRLGALRFADREDASRILEEIGEPALAHLRASLDSPDPEVRHRARELIQKLTEN